MRVIQLALALVLAGRSVDAEVKPNDEQRVLQTDSFFGETEESATFWDQYTNSMPPTMAPIPMAYVPAYPVYVPGKHFSPLLVYLLRLDNIVDDKGMGVVYESRSESRSKTRYG